jgi:hypothetical protein
LTGVFNLTGDSCNKEREILKLLWG